MLCLIHPKFYTFVEKIRCSHRSNGGYTKTLPIYNLHSHHTPIANQHTHYLVPTPGLITHMSV